MNIYDARYIVSHLQITDEHGNIIGGGGSHATIEVDSSKEKRLMAVAPGAVVTDVKLQGDGHLFRRHDDDEWQKELVIDRIEPYGKAAFSVRVMQTRGEIKLDYVMDKRPTLSHDCG